MFGANYFDVMIGEQPLYAKKPSPEGAFAIMDKLGHSPEDCIYVGDTNVDMITGKAAGMFTIGVLWGFREREELEAHGADVIVEQVEELLEYI